MAFHDFVLLGFEMVCEETRPNFFFGAGFCTHAWDYSVTISFSHF
jgi:hypothetical protein